MIATVLRVTLVIAAVPLCAFLLLTGSGCLPLVPALLAMAAVVLAAAGLAFMWTSDLRLLADLLHRAGTGDRGGGIGPRSLPPEVMGEVQLLSEALGARAALVDRLLRAEEGILERLPDPLIVLGADRAVRRANAAARVAFGEDVQAVLRHPQLRAAIDRALAPGAGDAPQTAELRVPVPVPREIQAMVVPLDSPLAGGAGVLAVLSDRTRERAVERTRADFVANASHELRTPLASLIGFIDTLRGPAADDPPAQARFLDIMADQAARMNRLIDDLLSLSRIEITEHQAPSEYLDVEELTGRILAGFELRIRERGIRLDFWPEPGLPRVLGDTDQFEQVVQNLVDNALKYGREGGIIRVKITPAAQGGKYPARRGLVLSVADDGPGIPREHLPRLTERFYRVDAGRSRAVGGTGLGLAIVKHIVNRHRGVLLIESEAGLGATFSIWLPAA